MFQHGHGHHGHHGGPPQPFYPPQPSFPGIDPSRLYQIRLSDSGYGSNANGILSCHRSAGRDNRGNDSAYVHINDSDCGSTRWRFIPVGPNAYKLMLADPQHGARAGYLSCHASVGTDRRGDDSVYVSVALHNSASCVRGSMMCLHAHSDLNMLRAHSPARRSMSTTVTAAARPGRLSPSGPSSTRSASWTRNTAPTLVC